jgi:DNA-binding NarL/FixJ family response regulator
MLALSRQPPYHELTSVTAAEVNVSHSPDSLIPCREEGLGDQGIMMLANNEIRSPGPATLNGTVHEQTDENRIRLVLLDDHGLFRASLARVLASEDGLEVVGECGTSGEALEIMSGSAVDVVLLLLDPDLGPEHANDFISSSRKGGYQGRFLIVGDAADAESSAMALKLGASGIFLKSEAPERLVQAIRLVARGGSWVDPKVIQLLAEQCLSHHPRLPDQESKRALEGREQKVLLGIIGGLKNKDIAKGMGIPERSVKNVLQGLFSRTGVRTRSHLVRLALEGSLGNVHHLVRRQEKAHAPEVVVPESPQSTDSSLAHRHSPG